jgi:hypothetical protein
MDDFVRTQKPTEKKPQTNTHSSAENDFEEDLRKQNINTMIEIYGADYMKKIDLLTR